MATLLIALIYLAFISMGLPDGLLGAAWPTIYPQFGVPVSYAGVLTVLIAAGTVISSLCCDRLLRRFGTGRVVAVCTLLTAVALFGFSLSSSFWMLCLWALPYGLGAGSIDAALNNYVAVKYRSREMSLVHFFWGVGAMTGPYVMGALLSSGAKWTQGYETVGILQAVMTVCLIAALPLFRKNDLPKAEASAERSVNKREALQLAGAKPVLLAFFCYCALESTAGLWASSYMTLHRGISAEEAAKWASLFYLGISAGRLMCSFITDRVGDRRMVRIGQGTIVVGAVLLLLPLGNALCFAALILIGVGCAPVYPCLLHETPVNFGAQNSQTIMGLQMATAYIGTTLMPPLFGLMAQHIHIGLFPVYLLALAALMMLGAEGLNRSQQKRAQP